LIVRNNFISSHDPIFAFYSKSGLKGIPYKVFWRRRPWINEEPLAATPHEINSGTTELIDLPSPMVGTPTQGRLFFVEFKVLLG
jgi:hypothetical protein